MGTYERVGYCDSHGTVLAFSHKITCINKLKSDHLITGNETSTRGTRHVSVLAWHERRRDSVQALAPLRSFLMTCLHVYSHKHLQCTRCKQSSVTRTTQWELAMLHVLTWCFIGLSEWLHSTVSEGGTWTSLSVSMRLLLCIYCLNSICLWQEHP